MRQRQSEAREIVAAKSCSNPNNISSNNSQSKPRSDEKGKGRE